MDITDDIFTKIMNIKMIIKNQKIKAENIKGLSKN